MVITSVHISFLKGAWTNVSRPVDYCCFSSSPFYWGHAAKNVWQPAETGELKERSFDSHAKKTFFNHLILAMVQVSWFKIRTVSFHPSPEWQSWSSHNFSLLEVTQECRIQVSSGMAGKKPLMFILSYATLKIPDVPQRVFHQEQWVGLWRENRTQTYWK